MKKIITMVSLALMLILNPVNVFAVEYGDLKVKNTTNTSTYGTIEVTESNWTEDSDSASGVSFLQKYSVTKVNSAGYVYISFNEDNNVKIRTVTPGSSFEIVGNPVSTTTGVTYLFKLKSGTSISATTELATVVADILVNDSELGCALSYSPLSLNCFSANNIYFDDDGKVVTEEEYNAACEGYVPDDPNDVPNAETGSVIPYIAIGGGLLAIACVYLYSKKSNKMYKI